MRLSIEVKVMLQVCSNCGKGSGEALAAVLAQDLELEKVSCLGVCNSPNTIALSSPGKITWVISDITPTPDMLEGLVAFVHLYDVNPTGDVPWGDRPLVIRTDATITAKLPPTH